MFDHALLDMIELGIANYVPIRDFRTTARPGIGNKPCFIFKGDEFDRIETFRKFRNLIVDILLPCRSRVCCVCCVCVCVCLTSLALVRSCSLNATSRWCSYISSAVL